MSVLFAFKAPTKVTLEVWTALAPPPSNPPGSSMTLPPDRPPLRLGLVSDVPDHWFPLIPEAAADRLTRYWMGVLPSSSREQEHQREGRRLTRRPAYARWVDGRVHARTSCHTVTGRGESSSGLVYDTSESR